MLCFIVGDGICQIILSNQPFAENIGVIEMRRILSIVKTGIIIVFINKRLSALFRLGFDGNAMTL